MNNILEDFTEVEKEKITEESELAADLELNSLDVVSIVVEIEKQFGITIQDRDIWKFHTIGDVLEYIKNKNEK